MAINQENRHKAEFENVRRPSMCKKRRKGNRIRALRKLRGVQARSRYIA